VQPANVEEYHVRTLMNGSTINEEAVAVQYIPQRQASHDL
jgi:hypothetical protein